MKRKTSRNPAPFLVFVFSFFFYLATLAPTFLWSDSAKLAIWVFERSFAGTGFGHHPVHTILGYVFSLLPLPLAYTQNLMSAFFASAALGLLFHIVVRQTGSIAGAACGAGALAVSQMFWLYAVINETYALAACFLLASLALALRWGETRRDLWLFLLAFVTGLGFANHAMSVLFLPGLLVLVWRREFVGFLRPHKLLLSAACFLLGAAPVFILPLFLGAGPADVLRGIQGTTSEHVALFGGGLVKLGRELARHPLYLCYQFPTPAVLLGVYGLARSGPKHRRLNLGLFVLWLPVVCFASFYFFQRQFAMLVPSFAVYAIWIGLGVSKVESSRFNGSMRWALPVLLITVVGLPPCIYYGTYRLVENRGLLSGVRKLPNRNTSRYYLFPPKQMERGAQRYAFDAFDQAERGAIVLADFNPGMALLYAQKVLGKRLDLDIQVRIDDWLYNCPEPAGTMMAYLDEQVRQRSRTVYLADDWEAYYHTGTVLKAYTLDRQGGPLLRVTVRSPHAGAASKIP